MATRLTGSGWYVGDGGESNAQVKGLSAINGGGGKQGIYDVSTTQNFPLGYRIAFDDGRVYRYAHFVSAVGPGKVVAQDFSVSGFASIDAKFTNSAGTGADQAAGATTIYLKDTDTFSTADAEDVYAGGYFITTDDQGEGHSLRIKSNTQGTAAGLMRLDLYDGLPVAVNSESSGGVVGNMYRNLAIANNGTDDVVSGVTVVDMAAGEYGWVQTWGVGAVLADVSAGTLAAGTIAQLSDGVNGAAQPFGGGAVNSEDDHSYAPEPILGYFITAITNAEHGPIFLQVSP
jgi:hypothetical protein